MVRKICDFCGEEFETKTCQKTCGKQFCKNALKNGRYIRHWEKMNYYFLFHKPFEKRGNCQKCGKPFERKVANQKYCSDPKCRKLRSQKYEANRKNDSQRKEYLKNYHHEYYLEKKKV